MLPRITIVTPSFNQGQFIGRTIESVQQQNYPNLEHIVVDGMSSDETMNVLSRYSHLQVMRERDRGQADAINKGFARATGDVLGFLNSDDTLLPSALHRVAAEINPSRGRHVVTGRCIYIDENDQPTGMEHLWAYQGLTRLLEIWKGHTIPQPSTFWTAEAWRRCGPMNVDEQLVLDYDLMCRFGAVYRFHLIDQVLATYRLHQQSKSCTRDDSVLLDQAVAVSRRYWGSSWRPRHLLLTRSLREFQQKKIQQRHDRAALWSIHSHLYLHHGGKKWGWLNRMGAAWLAPSVAWRRLSRWAAQTFLPNRMKGPDALRRVINRSPESTTWRSFTGRHLDELIGPIYRTKLQVDPKDRWLLLKGRSIYEGLRQRMTVEVRLDGKLLHRGDLGDDQKLDLKLPLEQTQPGENALEIQCDAAIVPYDLFGIADHRPLSLRLAEPQLIAMDEADRKAA